MKAKPILFSTGAFCLAAIAPCHAAISYATPGSTLSEDFDTLVSTNDSEVTWANNGTLPGWYAQMGSTNLTLIRASNGATARSNELLSLGAADAIDRALGSQTASVKGNTARIAVSYQNNSGFALTSFTLAYTGETWRDIGSTDEDGFTLQYQIFADGAGSINAATAWTTVPSLAYTGSDLTGNSSQGVDGNASPNFEDLSATVSGISWADGQEIWLRWTDDNSVQDAIGIDKVRFSAVPEPSTALLGALGALALLRRKRN